MHVHCISLLCLQAHGRLVGVAAVIFFGAKKTRADGTMHVDYERFVGREGNTTCPTMVLKSKQLVLIWNS